MYASLFFFILSFHFSQHFHFSSSGWWLFISLPYHSRHICSFHFLASDPMLGLVDSSLGYPTYDYFSHSGKGFIFSSYLFVFYTISGVNMLPGLIQNVHLINSFHHFLHSLVLSYIHRRIYIQLRGARLPSECTVGTRR